MPKAKANKVYATFVKGLITEAGPLTFPDNASTDELNCELYINGSRSRRLGFGLESDAFLSVTTVAMATWENYAISSFNWNTVAGNGNTNFFVLQVGDTLYFYDLSITPLSNAKESFSVDLTTFAAPGATNIDRYVVNAVTGRGVLFVVGEKIESFYVEYDPDLDTISTTQIDIEARDFEGVSDGLSFDEEPATLEKEHEYNLKNQGWLPPNSGGTNPITTYFTTASKYPPNSKQWWQGKDSNDDFSATVMQKFVAGNTSAPKGHYILKAFYQDRSDVSGVSNLPVHSVTGRPKALAFFAGRVWYAGVSSSTTNGNVYFSQILNDGLANVGYCYQQNDPTSEDLNELLATDGGVIPILEVGNILALFPMHSALLVMADNGVWSISGGAAGSGFKATDFSVNKISGSGIDAPRSVVSVEGVPIWWGKTGIHTIAQNQVSDRFETQNISLQTIQTFYDDIPPLSKLNATAGYDEASKRVFWLYSYNEPTDTSHRYRYDSVLVLDITLGAFYPWRISTLENTPYYLGGVFNMPLLSDFTEDGGVVSGADTVVSGADTVITPNPITIGGETFINFLCFKEGISNVQWTFGNFTSTSFFDWYNVDNVGVDYLSYFETGDELMGDVQRDKQAVYIHCYFNKTETGFVDETYTEYENPSSCYMQSKWEWADHSNSGKFGPRQQVYRFVKSYTPQSGVDFDNGFPVVITKNKVRGFGKALRLRFESESGKDFSMLGWAVAFSGNTEV